MNSAVLVEPGFLSLSLGTLKFSIGFWLHLSQSNEDGNVHCSSFNSINEEKKFEFVLSCTDSDLSKCAFKAFIKCSC